MSSIQGGGHYTLNTDATKTKISHGPGLFPFTRSNLGCILHQAFRASHGRDNTNSVLLPKKFIFKSYLPRSCEIICNKCLRWPTKYKESMCAGKWQFLPDPGQSGSKYFLSHDEEFIIKTLQDKEQECLKQILPRLCDFLTDNKQTLLPRFFGLYCYKGSGQTIRFVVMNNLLPSGLYIDKRFDLKGATKRKKAASVLKDDAFNKTYPKGFKMDAPYVNRLRELFELDCMYLRELGLTNYSLFIAVHDVGWSNNGDLLRVSVNKIRYRMRPSQSLGILEDRSCGVPAQVTSNRKVLLFLGIIHILQPYTFGRKVEHFFKSLIPGGRKAPVQPPRKFEERFLTSVSDTWFRENRQARSVV